MKKLIVLFLFFVGINTPTLRADNQLIDDARSVKLAFMKLQQSRSAKNQQDYLKHFPRKPRQFTRLFNSRKKDQLWDGSEYIFQLEHIAKNYPKETFELVMTLAATLKWQKEAPNYLQFVLMKIAMNNPFGFATQFSKLSRTKQNSIISFLNANPKGPAIGYEQLIYMLRRTGKDEIADRLQAGSQ